VGLIWALDIGPSRAIAGFTAGPGQVAGYLAGLAGHPGALLHASRAYAGLTGWLPRQLSLALIAAAAEVAVVGWIRRRRDRRWGTAAPYRPGLAVAARRRYTAAMLAAGGVVTADGACLGLDRDTGRRVSVSWPEAERGVLVTGSDAAAVAHSGIQLTWAAIRRRKAVLVIEVTGDPAISAALAAACAEVAAPLRGFGPDGPGCYEPLRGGHPGRTASLVLGMIDWSEFGDEHRRTITAWLTDACAVAAAAPGPPSMPVLDDLAGLLQSEALRARAARLPGYHPRRAALAERAEAAASALAADPASASAVAGQLSLLRASTLGRWLRPPAGAGSAPVSLGQALRDRAVVTFALDRAANPRSARMVAALAAADLLATLSELRAMAVRTDCLAWISGCEELPRELLAELVGHGAQTGAPVLLTTTSAAAAAALAGDVGVITARQPDELAATATLAEVTATGSGPGPAGTAGDGTSAGPPLRIRARHEFAANRPDRGRDALALLVRGTRPRQVRSGRTVPVLPAGRA
jgi:hypothetical protein